MPFIPFKVYNGTAQRTTNVIIWNGTATTSGGVATFNPTDDGRAAGNALFTNVYAIQVTAVRNTATATDVPLASVRILSADRRTLTVNVVNGVVLAVLGATMQFAPDGTQVYATLIGD